MQVFLFVCVPMFLGRSYQFATMCAEWNQGFTGTPRLFLNSIRDSLLSSAGGKLWHRLASNELPSLQPIWAADIQMAPASTRGYSTSRLHDNDVASLCKMFVSLLLYAYVASFLGAEMLGFIHILLSLCQQVATVV